MPVEVRVLLEDPVAFLAEEIVVPGQEEALAIAPFDPVAETVGQGLLFLRQGGHTKENHNE